MTGASVGSRTTVGGQGEPLRDLGDELPPEAEALYAVSAEILTVMELPRVLRLVVGRARSLMGADIAYAGLANEEDRTVRIVVTDGARTDGFGRVTLAFGEGVGGAVALDRRPIVIRNYAEDERPKRPSIAEIVAAEGIVSVAALPMLAHGRLVGVLWVGFRHDFEFTPRAMALLRALANLGGIAIENDRLYDRERTSVRELEEVRDDLEAQRGHLARTLSIQAEITRTLLEDLGKDRLADVIARAVDCPTIVLDRFLLPIAKAAPPGSDVDLEQIAPIVGRALAEHGIPSLRDASHQPVRFALGLPVPLGTAQLRTLPITAGRDLMGYMTIIEPVGGLTESGEIAMWAGVTGLALDLTKDRVAREVEQRLRGDLIREILSGRAVPDEHMLERAMHLGMDFSSPCWVALVHVGDADASLQTEDGRSRAAMHLVERVTRLTAPDAVVLSRDNAMVLVVRSRRHAAVGEPRIQALCQEVLDHVRRAQPDLVLSVGISRECQGIHEFRRAHAEAVLALRIVRDLRIAGRSVRFDDLGVFPLLLQSTQTDSLHRFAEDQLGRLLVYDVQRHAQLVPTLAALFANDGNLRRTAEACNIHLSTLKYRLERIEEVTGHDLHDADTRFNLQLALRIRQVEALLRSDVTGSVDTTA